MLKECFKLLRLLQKDSKKLFRFYRSYFVHQKSLDQDCTVGA